MTDLASQKPEEQLTNMEEVQTHIKNRAEKFISTLEAIGAGLGWEHISEAEGITHKESAQRQGDHAVFTGHGICQLAAFAICDALSPISQGISFDSVDLQTDFYAENWLAQKKQPFEKIRGHCIVKVVDAKSDNAVYIDAAYRQINHTAKDLIQFIPQKDLGNYYKNASGTIKIIPYTLEDKVSLFKEFKDYYGIKERDFNDLVATMA